MEKKLAKLNKAVIILGVIAILTLLFRLWPFFFIALALFIGGRIWCRILRAKLPKEPDAKTRPVKRRASRAKKGIGEQVSMWVNADYPNAKWVWAHVDTPKRIANGEDVFIILNGAGGYRRARVNITGNIVVALEYMKAPIRESVQEQKHEENTAENITATAPSANYDLMAYEWVEAHINELNERLNEAVGEGITDYLLSAKELPIPESWTSVCAELKRAGVSEAECVQEGIKIKIN